MRHLNLIRASAIAAAALAVVGTTAAVSASTEDPVAVRQELMKRAGTAIKAIKAAAKAGAPADAVEPANTIATALDRFPSLFPEGSDVGETEAKPEIWSEWTRFEQAASGGAVAAQRLAAVAQSGNGDDLGEALKTLAGACSGCHKPFRKPHGH